MKTIINFTFLFCFLLFFVCCNSDNDTPDTPTSHSISGFKFIGEHIIPDGTLFNNEVIGGLSSIDYHDGVYYLISDTPKTPIRFYTASLDFNASEFNGVKILSQVELLTKTGASFGEQQVDPEAIRFDAGTNAIVWASEGFVNNQVDPFVRTASLQGGFTYEYALPEIFKASSVKVDTGARNNGVFEGLCASFDKKGYWVGMELPLKQDGVAPVFGEKTDSKVRIAYIDKATKKFGHQFTYSLGSVVRNGGFTVNGLVEILAYDTDRFLVLERSFASGTADGGNDVFIYKVDASKATDVSSLSSLTSDVVPATKELLFSFNSIRPKLSSVPGSTAKVVDNLEGMTFGPTLPNGHASLVLVADNNFSAFGAQLNQFIVLEVLP
ncbi:esterase-like activity of phytase family protein [Tenacibaculum sp. 190524A02b]|uniref:esterase-like activity of phytase family protein n=1 Tax=Tenacibaculum vairaonense TaxID=3137860 RepID=UPI0031FB822D